MVTTTRIRMADISRQKRFEARLDGAELTPGHTVGQAIGHYLDSMRIPDQQLKWNALSRGVKLDNKQRLSEIDEAETQWTVMPDVSAG